MANICDNKFYFTCKENFSKYTDKLNKILDEQLDGDVTYAEYHDDEDGGWMEGYFNSKWCFPEEIFEEFLEDGIDDGVYFRCLSEEYGCDYVAMNIFDDNGWREPQTFDL